MIRRAQASVLWNVTSTYKETPLCAHLFKGICRERAKSIRICFAICARERQDRARKNQPMKRYLLIAVTIVAALAPTGCKEKTPSEEAADSLQRAAEKTGEAMKDAAEKTGEAVKEGAEKAADKVNEATK
jgi:hypothetical protein